MRHAKWQGRLSDAIKAARREPFAWGTFDCAIWACRAVEAVTGTNPVPDLVGSYDTEFGAGRWLVERGYSDLAAAVDDFLGERKPAAFAQRGDIVYLADLTCGVVDLTGEFAVGLSPDEGTVKVSLLNALHAWSVG